MYNDAVELMRRVILFNITDIAIVNIRRSDRTMVSTFIIQIKDAIHAEKTRPLRKVLNADGLAKE